MRPKNAFIVPVLLSEIAAVSRGKAQEGLIANHARETAPQRWCDSALPLFLALWNIAAQSLIRGERGKPLRPTDERIGYLGQLHSRLRQVCPRPYQLPQVAAL